VLLNEDVERPMSARISTHRKLFGYELL